MPTAEHNVTQLLRSSGALFTEVEHHDIVLHRRDGEDLFLGLRSRERVLRDSLGLFAQVMRSALHDETARMVLAKRLSEGLAWTSFLPEHVRVQFLEAIATTAVACYEIDSYEPLVQELASWKATAESYALPGIAEQLTEHHKGPAVPLQKPRRRV